MFLRKSTAGQEILLGHFVDSTDGDTAETALTIANTDIKLWKHGTTTEANKNSGGATHIASGRYYAVLDATDTDTVGMLEVAVKVAGALAVTRRFQVLEEAVYDALFAASATGVPAAGATAAELAKVPKSDGTTTWNATALASINAECDTALTDYDAPTNTEMAAAFTEIKGATWATTDTLEAIRDRGDAAWTTATGFSTHSAEDVWSVATRVLTAGTNIGFPSASTIADSVWDQDTLNLTTGVGAFLVAMDARTIVIDNIVDDILVDTGTTIPGTITTLQGNVTDILTDTGTTLPAQISALNNLSAAAVNAEVDTAISEYFGVAGSSLTGIPWNAAWDAEVQSECTDAINALFTFTAAGFVDANIQKINDVNIVGNGVSPKFGV